MTDKIKTENPHITYMLMSFKPSPEELQSAHMKKPDWYVEDALLDGRLSYTRKFKVYAKVTKMDFIPRGTRLVDPETRDFVEVTKSDQYFKYKRIVDVTPLFKIELNPTKNKAKLVPKTINTYSWIKNNDLRVDFEVEIDRSKSKKKKPKGHKRFYNQFSNNKNY